MTSEERDAFFEELYQRHYQSVVRFFQRFGFSKERAREFAQDTFTRVYGAMDTYRGDAEWKFLETTARRVALNAIRREKKTLKRKPEESLDALPHLPASLANDPWTGAPPPSPEADLIEVEKRRRLRQRLKEALKELPDLTRECLRFRIEGRKYREICEELGLTMDAVKTRLYDARKRLREQLGEEPEGVDWPDGPPEKDND